MSTTSENKNSNANQKKRTGVTSTGNVRTSLETKNGNKVKDRSTQSNKRKNKQKPYWQPKVIATEEKVNVNDGQANVKLQSEKKEESNKSEAIKESSSHAGTQESENEKKTSAVKPDVGSAYTDTDTDTDVEPEGEEKRIEDEKETDIIKNMMLNYLMGICGDEELVNTVIKIKDSNFFKKNSNCRIGLMQSLVERWETNNQTLVVIATQIHLIWKNYVLKKKVKVSEKIRESIPQWRYYFLENDGKIKGSNYTGEDLANFTWRDLANENFIHFSEEDIDNNPLQTFEIDRMVLLYLANKNQYKREKLFENALSSIWVITTELSDTNMEKLFYAFLKLLVGTTFADDANKSVEFTKVFNIRNHNEKLADLLIEPIELSPYEKKIRNNFIDEFPFLIGEQGALMFTRNNPSFDVLMKLPGLLNGKKKNIWIFFEVKSIDFDEAAKEKKKINQKLEDYSRWCQQKKTEKQGKQDLPASECNTSGNSQSNEKKILCSECQSFRLWKIRNGNYSTVKKPKTTVGKIENQQMKLISDVDNKLNELSKSGKIDLKKFMRRNVMVYVGISLRDYENSDQVFLLDHYNCFGVLKPFLDMMICGN